MSAPLSPERLERMVGGQSTPVRGAAATTGHENGARDLRYRSRKLQFALLVFLTATFLVVLGYLSAESWEQVAFWTLLLYSGANVGDTLANKWAGTFR